MSAVPKQSKETEFKIVGGVFFKETADKGSSSSGNGDNDDEDLWNLAEEDKMNDFYYVCVEGIRFWRICIVRFVDEMW